MAFLGLSLSLGCLRKGPAVEPDPDGLLYEEDGTAWLEEDGTPAKEEG